MFLPLNGLCSWGQTLVVHFRSTGSHQVRSGMTAGPEESPASSLPSPDPKREDEHVLGTVLGRSWGSRCAQCWGSRGGVSGAGSQPQLSEGGVPELVGASGGSGCPWPQDSGPRLTFLEKRSHWRHDLSRLVQEDSYSLWCAACKGARVLCLPVLTPPCISSPRVGAGPVTCLSPTEPSRTKDCPSLTVSYAANFHLLPEAPCWL